MEQKNDVFNRSAVTTSTTTKLMMLEREGKYYDDEAEI